MSPLMKPHGRSRRLPVADEVTDAASVDESVRCRCRGQPCKRPCGRGSRPVLWITVAQASGGAQLGMRGMTGQGGQVAKVSAATYRGLRHRGSQWPRQGGLGCCGGENSSLLPPPRRIRVVCPAIFPPPARHILAGGGRGAATNRAGALGALRLMHACDVTLTGARSPAGSCTSVALRHQCSYSN